MQVFNSNVSPSPGPSPRFLQGLLQRRTRFWLWAGFGGLLFLMCLLGGLAVSFLYQVEIQQNRIRQEYIERDRLLQRMRGNIYLSGTHVRDFLLDPAQPPSPAHQQQFLDNRQEIEKGLADYARLIPPNNNASLQLLRGELKTYLDTITAVFRWNAEERRSRSNHFVEQEVLPRRLHLLGLADRIQELSERQSEMSSQELGEALSSFRLRLALLLALTLSLGALLAGTTLWRILQLEKESLLRFEEVISAREESKRLSADLLSAQESERRRISRELHDEVGQALYATMLRLGNLRSSLKSNNVEESLRQLQEVEEMSSRTVNVVRNISLLLRPAMLDDLGLVPALKWLAREVARTHSIQVDVFAGNVPEELPEEHRTCVYRVVQESIHNAVRHSGARQVRVDLQTRFDSKQTNGRLSIVVQDDGKGFDPEKESGVGILGMEERMVQLGGVLKIESEPGRGTVVSFELPLPQTLNHQAIRPLRTA